MKHSIIVVACAALTGCTVPLDRSLLVTNPPLIAAPASSPATGSKRIVYDGAGGFTLPDGSTVREEGAGEFTLPNGAYVARDRAGGVSLPNGTRCSADGAGGYICP